MKNCIHCNNEFEDISIRGTEQKYCSVKCRTNAANKRHQEKIINKVKMEYEEKTNNSNVGADIEKNRNNNNNESKREDYFSFTGGNISNNNYLRLLETNYNTKANALSFELRNEQLQKENEELKKKVELLELELEDLENEIDQEPEQMGMIGNVMEQFKQDPVNTINFATSLLQNLFKRKPNEVTNEEKK